MLTLHALIFYSFNPQTSNLTKKLHDGDLGENDFEPFSICHGKYTYCLATIFEFQSREISQKCNNLSAIGHCLKH